VKRFPLLLGLLLAAALPIEAARPSLEVSLDPEKLGVEDVTRLSIRIVNAGRSTPQTSLGQLNNFRIVQGPSRESQFSLINGHATSALKLTWVLQPQGTGKAAIGPITVKVGDETLSAGALVAEILPGSLAPKRPRRVSPFGVNDPFEQFFGRPRSAQRSLKVVLRQILSAGKAVEGESLIATVVLDTNGGSINGFEWADPPDYPGFWVQRIKQPDQVQPKTVQIDGQAYYRFVLARSVLIPLKAGDMTIPAASARVGFRGLSFFAPSSVVERSTGVTHLKVLQRPQPPEEYSGAVGKLRYSISVQPRQLKLGESATIKIEVKGQGNLPLIEAPHSWPGCADCKVYPPEEENSVQVDDSGIHGSRSWSATILPRRAGSIELNAVPVAVFDPGTMSYRRQQLGPLHLEVEAPEPTPEPTRPVSAGGVPQEATPPPGNTGGRQQLPAWVLIAAALLLGVVGGGGVVFLLSRRSASHRLPPRQRGQSPAERARQLQAALEAWWLELPESRKDEAAEAGMKALRKELEAVRFAPGRADHSGTIAELEKRLRRLMR